MLPVTTIKPGDSPALGGEAGSLTDQVKSALANPMTAMPTLLALAKNFGWVALATVLVVIGGVALVKQVYDWISGNEPFVLGGGGVVQGGNGSAIVKRWNTGGAKGGGWDFWLTADGRIHTINKSGIEKSYKPRKPVVLVPGHLTLGNAVKAQRMLDRQWRVVAKRTKALKLA